MVSSMVVQRAAAKVAKLAPMKADLLVEQKVGQSGHLMAVLKESLMVAQKAALSVVQMVALLA
jgi:hypothetical protein